MKKTEVLAPAGSYEALEAAVRCGADAVYLGSGNFNARRNAANFDDSTLKKAIDYCHERCVKVYLTLNTLVKDSEITGLSREIENFIISGVDAFIIQDLAVAKIIKKIYPDMAVHASTQMSVQSGYGMEMLKELGFKRAVLPRELSRKEIEKISRSTDLELECFVHGALCMCLSGQCLMSSVLGGRSGNRGLCAQPCRLPYGIDNANGHFLSLKDLSLIDKIPQLIECGVSSLKIEGRMKRPEYVAAAVTACRNKIDGKTDEEIRNALAGIFSRSGFTSGYFDSRIDRDMFGIRTKENVESSAKSLKILQKLYENENPLLAADMKFTLKRDKKPLLEAKCNNITVSVSSDEMPVRAENKALTLEEAKTRFSKCGGTQFYVNGFTAEIDEGLYISAAGINALRRKALENLTASLRERKTPETGKFEFTLTGKENKSAKKLIYLSFFDSNEIPDNASSADLVFIPLDTSGKTVDNLLDKKIRLAAHLPVNVFSNGDLYLEKLAELKRYGIDTVMADNADGIIIARKAGMKIIGGIGTNIMNSVSLQVMKEHGVSQCLLSPEMHIDSVNSVKCEIPAGALVYGRLPLMVTRNCPVRNKFDCSRCKKTCELTDRKNIKFPVRCKFGASFVFNSHPVEMFDKKAEFHNTDFDFLMFTTETKEEAENIIDSYFEGVNPDKEYTRGLYFKKLL